MNAHEFLGIRLPQKIETREWIAGISKLVTGIIVLCLLVRQVPPEYDLLRGWLGMLGLIMVLHFGLFHLLSLAFRRAGIDAEPVMNEPLKARSVAEFWSKRWNTAFNQLAHRFIFRKAVGTVGVAAALLLTFGVSGLIHDLVISIPAGGGYGLPTVYFLIQATGVITERSHIGRAIGLGNGALGRAFTIAVTAIPAFWLFHPMFVRNVILPFLRAIDCC
jgi:alginate O-acetyltransferase complex protein AlgI